jgi:formylmethanofuran dehydrogenase subunit E
MKSLDELLETSAALHRHLCPRQVLGARMGILGAQTLGLAAPREDKRLLTFVETDGCAADAISVATGCRVGARTLRVIDFGKVAATFVDVKTEQAVRVVPRLSVRERARAYAPDATSRWQAQLLGYQRMPEAELLEVQPVALAFSLAKLLSKAGQRATCQHCGEEVINEREVVRDGVTLCRACAGQAYYRLVGGLAPLAAGQPLNLSIGYNGREESQPGD